MLTNFTTDQLKNILVTAFKNIRVGKICSSQNNSKSDSNDTAVKCEQKTLKKAQTQIRVHSSVWLTIGIRLGTVVMRFLAGTECRDTDTTWRAGTTWLGHYGPVQCAAADRQTDRHSLVTNYTMSVCSVLTVSSFSLSQAPMPSSQAVTPCWLRVEKLGTCESAVCVRIEPQIKLGVMTRIESWIELAVYTVQHYNTCESAVCVQIECQSNQKRCGGTKD